MAIATAATPECARPPDSRACGPDFFYFKAPRTRYGEFLETGDLRPFEQRSWPLLSLWSKVKRLESNQRLIVQDQDRSSYTGMLATAEGRRARSLRQLGYEASAHLFRQRLRLQLWFDVDLRVKVIGTHFEKNKSCSFRWNHSICRYRLS